MIFTGTGQHATGARPGAKAVMTEEDAEQMIKGLLKRINEMNQTLHDKEQEIVRLSLLRTEHEIEIDQIHDRQLAEKDATIERLKMHITELCDALEEEFGTNRPALKDKRPWDLIQRAREATK